MWGFFSFSNFFWAGGLGGKHIGILPQYQNYVMKRTLGNNYFGKWHDTGKNYTRKQRKSSKIVFVFQLLGLFLKNQMLQYV